MGLGNNKSMNKPKREILCYLNLISDFSFSLGESMETYLIELNSNTSEEIVGDIRKLYGKNMMQ